MKKERLSRRESEVMEILHRLESGTAAEVRDAMEDAPTDPAVRSTLRILVDKGHLTFGWDGPRYVYTPAVSTNEAGRSALEGLLDTFFDGSTEGVMTALLDMRGGLSNEERTRLKKLIDEAAAEGR